MRPLTVSALFILSLGLGLWVSDRSWNGQLFVYVGEERSPAAIRSLGEYSSLDRTALYRTAEAQLMGDARVFQEDGRIGVQMGHPLMNRKGGGKEFACQVQDHSGLYDRIEMIFVGTGATEGGEAPRMIVNTRCRSEQDLNQLDTVWIPTQTILASAPANGEYLFPSADPVAIRLEMIPDEWPESWVLWSVRLYREDRPDESLLIDTDRLRQARPQLLSLDWKAQ